MFSISFILFNAFKNSFGDIKKLILSLFPTVKLSLQISLLFKNRVFIKDSRLFVDKLTMP